MRETDRHRKRERENEGVEGVAILHEETVSYLLIKLSDVKFSPSDCAYIIKESMLLLGQRGARKLSRRPRKLSLAGAATLMCNFCHHKSFVQNTSFAAIKLCLS